MTDKERPPRKKTNRAPRERAKPKYTQEQEAKRKAVADLLITSAVLLLYIAKALLNG